MQNSKEIVRAFYEECLTVSGTANLTERLTQLLADGFESRNAAGTKGKDALIGQINGFWKLMPDMRWEIQDRCLSECGQHQSIRNYGICPECGDAECGSKCHFHRCESRAASRFYRHCQNERYCIPIIDG